MRSSLKTPDDIFGKNYQTRPGDDIKKKSTKKVAELKRRIYTPNPNDLMRPGAVFQPPTPYIFDFEAQRANDIFKYGEKVRLNESQVSHTFTEMIDGVPTEVTKNLSELSYDVSKKLDELEAITKNTVNQPLNDKMDILNALTEEITGKFRELSNNDMRNISRVLFNLGENIKNPEDAGLSTAYLTAEQFIDDIKTANGADIEITLWLAVKFAKSDFTRFPRGGSKRLNTPKDVLNYLLNHPKSIFDLKRNEIIHVPDWDAFVPVDNGKIDYIEYDQHPYTIASKTNATQAVAQAAIAKAASDKKILIAKLNKDITNLQTLNAKLGTKMTNFVDDLKVELQKSTDEITKLQLVPIITKTSQKKLNKEQTKNTRLLQTINNPDTEPKFRKWLDKYDNNQADITKFQNDLLAIP